MIRPIILTTITMLMLVGVADAHMLGDCLECGMAGYSCRDSEWVKCIDRKPRELCPDARDNRNYKEVCDAVVEECQEHNRQHCT